MAKFSRLAGATSQSVNIFIQNSSVTTGAGLTGFAPAGGSLLSGMIFYYSFSGTNAASVAQSLSVPATVGAAFSAGSIVEIDATHMPGIARLDIPNAMIAASKGNTVTGYISGGTNVAPCVFEIELTAVDNQSTAYGLSIAKTTNITGFNDIAATAIVSSGAITTSSGAVSTVTTVTNQLTSAAIATGVWTDTTAGDFTTSASIGKSIMNGVALGTGLTINGYTGNTVQTGDSFARIGSTGSGLTSLATPTNITAGTITTVTNLTNAPTAGDFTSTMKTSIVTAVAASAVASVTAAVSITSNRKKASTATFEFLMQDSTTGAPKTGLTVTSKISKDGGAAASTTNSVTEIGLGQYQIVLTGTEMTANNIFMQFTATGAVTSNLSIQTQP